MEAIKACVTEWSGSMEGVENKPLLEVILENARWNQLVGRYCKSSVHRVYIHPEED